jgi:hypothetical protein
VPRLLDTMYVVTIELRPRLVYGLVGDAEIFSFIMILVIIAIYKGRKHDDGHVSVMVKPENPSKNYSA